MSSAFRLSLAANIALAGIVAVLLWRDRPERPSTVISPERPAAMPAAKPRAEVLARDLPAPVAGTKFNPAVVTQLEQAGISRQVLVSALREDFQRRWDQRLLQLEQQHAPKPLPERQYIEFARQRDAEQVRELKEALGEPGYQAWDREETLRTLNTAGLPLTAAEAERAYRLQKEFDAQHLELERAMEDGIADRADAATLQVQAREALDRELATLLGRERYDEMRGITGPVAEVNWRYSDLNPTPGQAHAVLRAEEDYRAREAALAGQLHGSAADPAAVAAELQAMNAAREESLRQIFGPVAYDETKRQNDPTYKTLQQYAGAWELNAAEVQSVYQALQVLRDRTDRTRSAATMSEAAGQPVNWPETNATIEQARQQAEAELATLIGAERLRRLKQNGLLDGGG